MRLLFIYSLFMALAPTYGQTKLHSVSLGDTLMAVSMDRPGDIYTVTQTGHIRKYNEEGKLLLLYKADTLPALFDPRDGSRLFIYYREQQRYRYVNTSFRPLASYEIDPAFAIQPWLIAPSGEYKLWILDRADNSLKNIDIREAEVAVEVNIAPDHIEDARRFMSLREYQGFVFLHHAGGIEIFNRLGTHLRHIDAPGIKGFNFMGEDLYYLKGNEVTFFNLFNTQRQQLLVPEGYQHVLLTENRLILFTALQMDFYTLPVR